MGDVNLLIIKGNLIDDAKLRYTARTRKPILSFKVITGYKWHDDDGAPQERKTSHFVEYKPRSEAAISYFRERLVRGATVFVQGSSWSRKIEQPNKPTRYLQVIESDDVDVTDRIGAPPAFESNSSSHAQSESPHPRSSTVVPQPSQQPLPENNGVQAASRTKPPAATPSTVNDLSWSMTMSMSPNGTSIDRKFDQL